MPARLKRPLRSIRRLSALAGVLATAATALTFRPAHLRSLRTRALWLQATCRSVLQALGVSWTPVGQPPARGVVIASNHLSYLDILVLAAMTPTVFVAKQEVRGWPVFGWFARMAGTRFVDRGRRSDVTRVGGELAAVLAEGLSIVLFLEGTSSDGRTVKPFRSSLLEPATQARWPVVPVALAYTVPPGCSVTQEVCWWGDMTLPPHLFNLAGLPRIDARVAWGQPLPYTADRKILAGALHQHVTQLLAALNPAAEYSLAGNAPGVISVLAKI